MLILVYFASDFQHNSNIVYVRPYQQNYLWTFCLMIINNVRMLHSMVQLPNQNIHCMHTATYSSLLLNCSMSSNEIYSLSTISNLYYIVTSRMAIQLNNCYNLTYSVYNNPTILYNKPEYLQLSHFDGEFSLFLKYCVRLRYTFTDGLLHRKIYFNNYFQNYFNFKLLILCLLKSKIFFSLSTSIETKNRKLVFLFVCLESILN